MMQCSSSCFLDPLGVVYRSLRRTISSAFRNMRWRLQRRYRPKPMEENLPAPVKCSQENDENLLLGSLGTNNTSPTMHMDAGLADVKKIECVHYKTNNGEFDFYSLELK